MKRLAKILNSNPDLIASASERKILKLKKKKKETKPAEYGMRLRHQKFTLSETELACQRSLLDYFPPAESKVEPKAEDKDSIPDAKKKDPELVSTPVKNNVLMFPPEKTEISEEKSEDLKESPVVKGDEDTEDAKEDVDGMVRRSMPRRAKRPASSSPVKRPLKKRGRRKVIFLCQIIRISYDTVWKKKI